MPVASIPSYGFDWVATGDAIGQARLIAKLFGIAA
jgi:hypothetical protein